MSGITIILQTKIPLSMSTLLDIFQNTSIESLFHISSIQDINNFFKIILKSRPNVTLNQTVDFINRVDNTFELLGFNNPSPSIIEKTNDKKIILSRKLVDQGEKLKELVQINDQNKESLLNFITADKYHEQVQKLLFETYRNASRIQNCINEIKQLRNCLIDI